MRCDRISNVCILRIEQDAYTDKPEEHPPTTTTQIRKIVDAGRLCSIKIIIDGRDWSSYNFPWVDAVSSLMDGGNEIAWYTATKRASSSWLVEELAVKGYCSPEYMEHISKVHPHLRRLYQYTNMVLLDPVSEQISACRGVYNLIDPCCQTDFKPLRACLEFETLITGRVILDTSSSDYPVAARKFLRSFKTILPSLRNLAVSFFDIRMDKVHFAVAKYRWGGAGVVEECIKFDEGGTDHKELGVEVWKIGPISTEM